MKDRFVQWFSKEITKNKTDEESLSIVIVAWLFTLYFEVTLFLQRKNYPKINDRHMLSALNDYIYDAIEYNWNLKKVKNNIIKIIEENYFFFNLRDMEPYQKELIELITVVDNNSKKLNPEVFDFRINLNLSSANDFYHAKKNSNAVLC